MAPDNVIVTLGWGAPAAREALYGTALTIDASGACHLVNPLMPGGTVLQEWSSVTDYAADRATPVLPLLYTGRRYAVTVDAQSVPGGAFLVEVAFADRFGAALGTEVLYAPAFEFTYPLGAHHYTIRLVNAGCDELRFTSLSLAEVATSTDGTAHRTARRAADAPAGGVSG
jgi:accessory secretory protein Asp3